MKRVPDTSKTPPGPRPLKDLLAAPQEPSGALGRLRAEVEKRLELLDFLRAAVPAELQAAVEACNLREDGTLVISTSSPGWAARLRYEGTALLARCRQRHPEATRLRVRVMHGER